MSMECVRRGCPGELEARLIIHTFIRQGQPIVVEDLPAQVCSICGYTVLEIAVLDLLFNLDPVQAVPVGQAPVFRLTLPEAV